MKDMKDKNNIRLSFDLRAKQWAELYKPKKENIGSYKNIQRKKDVIKLVESEFDALLDIGCGTGDIIFELLKKNKDSTALGVDFSGEMIEIAKKEAQKEKLEKRCRFERMDIEKFEDLTGKKFDLILAVGLMEYLEDDRKFLKNIEKTMKKNGVLILTVPNNTGLFYKTDRAISAVYYFIKDNFLTKNIFDFIKFVVLKKKRTKTIKPGQQKTYNPEKFKLLLSQSGFMVEKDRFNFWGVEWPARIFPPLIHLFKWLEKLENTPLRKWGKNYIVRARKIE